MHALVLLAAATVVTPGTVVRWAAPGTTACVAADRTFAPVGDTCYFPIDLGASGALRLARERGGREEAVTVRVGDYPYPTQHLTVPEKMVHLSKEDLERTEREAARVKALWLREGPPGFALPLGPPLAKLPAGGRFGARRFFNGEARAPHSGVDYGAPAGTPVLAVADGVVVLAEEHFFAGRAVFVDHGGGLLTMYFHLEQIAVEPGERVQRGQAVGRVGATGRAVGPHLHFAARWHGARVDPTQLMAAGAIPSLPAPAD